MRIIYIFLPVMAVLFLIYSTYEREFFAMAFIGPTEAVLIYVLSRLSAQYNMGLRVVVFTIGLAICALAIGLYLLSQKKSRSAMIKKLKISMFGRNTTRVISITAYSALSLLLMVAFIFGGVVAGYCMFTAIIALVCGFVYYTIRLM